MFWTMRHKISAISPSPPAGRIGHDRSLLAGTDESTGEGYMIGRS